MRSPPRAIGADSVDLSIVIVSWNVRELLARCLASIQAHRSSLTLEIIVIDNASTDGSPERVRAEFPDVVVMVNAENRGFATANNQAIAVATGRYVLLLNPDTLWVDDSLATLVAFLDAHPRVGAAGPKLLNADATTIQYWGGRRLPKPADTLIEYSKFDRVFPNSALSRRQLIADWDHQDSHEVECLSGACMVVRAETIREVGALDEGYPLYSEDTDWCHRIRRKGWGIHYLAEAKVIHIGQQSSLQNRGPSTVKAVTGVYRYYRKFYGPLTVLRVWAGIWVISVAKLVAWAILRITGRTERRVANDQVRAYWSICWLLPPLSRL
jgi:GT2 family glycosyltransferase